MTSVDDGAAGAGAAGAGEVGVGGGVAPGTAVVATQPQAASLLAGPFRPLWFLTFIAYGFDALLRAIVPIIALDRGGDAVLVGLLGAAFAVPSVVFRPIVGSLIDSWQHRLVLRSGTLAMAVLPLLLLLPGSLPLLLARFAYGTAWAAFSVSNHAVLAKLAPPARRAQAAGAYLTAGAIGALILQPLGVRLYADFGVLPPILFVAALALAGLAAALRLEIPSPSRLAADGEPQQRGSLLARFIEPAALPGTLMLVTAYSSWSIFTVFPPVYALHVGEPVEALVGYFIVWGLFQVLPQPIAGRLGDHLGRARSMVLGAGVAIAALLIALIPGFVPFTAAAALYATSQSLVMATISALTMERAPKGRLGSAMATYSLGYQVATGLSSLLWGAVITALGFEAVFVGALALQGVTLVLVRTLLGRRRPRGASGTGEAIA